MPSQILSASFAPDDQTLVVGGTDAEMSFFGVRDLSREGIRIQPATAASGPWYAFYNQWRRLEYLQRGQQRPRRSALPPVVDSPDACIAANGGDWNGCNVGNSGRGDLPYWHTN